jgi:hypothetical protein
MSGIMPKWHYNPQTGAGDIGDLQTNLNNTASTDGKPIVVVETGFASRGAQFEPDYEFDVSAEGQKQFLETVIDVVQNVPNGLGQGVSWWYAEARPTSGLNVWEGGRYGLFDQNGNLLPAASAYEQFINSLLPGDYNRDGSVDAADYVVWRKSFGQTGPNLAADGDHSGTVDQADYDHWQTAFGQTANGILALARVPERVTPVLLVIAIGYVISCREGRNRVPKH